MRTRIWKNLENSVYKGFFVDELILLAIASSGSVAAWAVWDVLPLIWGGIIAASNVLVVVKPYFPFSKYLKELKDKKTIALSLNIDFERLWYEIENDQVSEKEAAAQFFKLREKMNVAFNFEEDIPLQNNTSVEMKAAMKTKIHIEMNYETKIEIS